MILYLKPGAQQAVYGVVPSVKKDNRLEAAAAERVTHQAVAGHDG